MFVVTGMGRSGTMYVSRLLLALGIPTTHEQSFNQVKAIAPTTHGDVAWEAAPHLASLPPTMPVVHLIRDPRRVIPSWVAVDGGRADGYMQYAARHCGFDYFAHEPHHRALLLWRRWNELVRAQRPTAPLFRLEELMQIERVQRLVEALARPVPASAAVDLALKSLPRNTNHGPTPVPTPVCLIGELERTAVEAGYGPRA